MTKIEFHPDCDFPNCKEKKVLCNAKLKNGNICNRYGHPDYYKHDEEHLIMVIEHGHFTNNKDEGRNCIHSTGKVIKAPRSIRVYTWRTYRGKDRWLKIPKQVRKALGWI